MKQTKRLALCWIAAALLSHVGCGKKDDRRVAKVTPPANNKSDTDTSSPPPAGQDSAGQDSAGGDTAAQESGWGSVKGRFVVDGDVPEMKAITVTKDEGYCGEKNLKDESVVVGEGGGLANLFVYLVVKRGKSVDMHPDYEKVEPQPIVLDNKNCRFEPHGLVVWTKHPLEIRNSDPGIGHNTNALTLVENPAFNDQIPNDSPMMYQFAKSEPLPARVQCSIHPWMNAYLLIRDNPYIAVSDDEGRFEIKNLPSGRHEFQFYHEASGYVRNTKMGKAKTNKKGRAKLTIPAGGTLDLGDVQIQGSSLVVD